jgi:hypothetical protein
MPPILACWLKKVERRFEADIAAVRLVYRGSSTPLKQSGMQRAVT